MYGLGSGRGFRREVEDEHTRIVLVSERFAVDSGRTHDFELLSPHDMPLDRIRVDVDTSCGSGRRCRKVGVLSIVLDHRLLLSAKGPHDYLTASTLRLTRWNLAWPCGCPLKLRVVNHSPLTQLVAVAAELSR